MKKIFLPMLCIAVNCYAQSNIVLIADPRVLAIPIHENHEPLVDLATQNEISYDHIPLQINNTKIRRTIYNKLLQAQKLLPDGLKFRLYEGYRSLAQQQKTFQERYNKIKHNYPEMTYIEIFTETTKFVSPVINLDGSKNIPPHATGAAIDIYLVTKNGKMVDMGIKMQDIYKDLKGEYCKTDSQLISSSAKHNRKIMGDALLAAGFVNYPTEFWHWSYGDRYWAYQTQHKSAVYNNIS